MKEQVFEEEQVVVVNEEEEKSAPKLTFGKDIEQKRINKSASSFENRLSAISVDKGEDEGKSMQEQLSDVIKRSAPLKYSDGLKQHTMTMLY